MKTTFLNPSLDPSSLRLNTSDRGNQNLNLSMKWRDAWTNAMEQQQANAWLQHGLIKRDVLSMSDKTQIEMSSVSTTIRQKEYDPKFSDLGQSISSERSDSIDSGKRQFNDDQFGKIDAGSKREPKTATAKGAELTTTGPSLVKARDVQAIAAENAQIHSFHSQVEEAGSQNLGNSNAVAEKVALDPDPTVSSLNNDDVSQVTSELKQMTTLVFGASPITSAQQGLALSSDLKQQIENFFSPRVNMRVVSFTNEHLSDADTGATTIQNEAAQQDDELVSLEDFSRIKDLESAKSERQTRDTLRFHAEVSEMGVKIWLGLDQSEQANLPMLVTHLLDWLNLQHLPLASLVCNGKGVSVKRGLNSDEAVSAETQAVLDRSKVGQQDTGLTNALMSTVLTSNQTNFISYVRNQYAD